MPGMEQTACRGNIVLAVVPPSNLGLQGPEPAPSPSQEYTPEPVKEPSLHLGFRAYALRIQIQVAQGGV